MDPLGDPVQDTGVSGLLARVPVDRRRTFLWASTVVTALLFLAISVLGLPLRTDAAPLGIVFLQFAASPEAAERMLASWSSVPRERLLWAHGLDLLLPAAYALAIGLAGLRAAAITRAARRAAMSATGAAVAAALADQVENVAMAVTILLGPGWPGVLVTLVAATAKWTLLVLAVGALVVACATARGARVEA